MVMVLLFLFWLGYQTEWTITALLSSYFAMSIEPLIWTKFRYLKPFNSRGWLCRKIINYSRDAIDLIENTRAHFGQQSVGQ